MNRSFIRRSLRRTLSTTAIAGAMAVFSFAAMAGECPADKVIAASNLSNVTEPVGVSDTVIAAIELAELNPALSKAQFRMRRMVIQPGGVVPLHSHAERPANIYMIEGTLTEYRNTCAVPIEHTAGEVVSEFGQLSHWWKNTTDKPAVLISADILHGTAADDNVM